MAVFSAHRKPGPNGFVSYFDPLTKYCLATQALIERCLQNWLSQSTLSSFQAEWYCYCKRGLARGPSPSHSKCTQAGSTCIQSPHWTLFYKSLASLIITQSKKFCHVNMSSTCSTLTYGTEHLNDKIINFKLNDNGVKCTAIRGKKLLWLLSTCERAMSGEESNADEDGRLHAGPAQAAQQGPVLPVMTLEKKCLKSAVAVPPRPHSHHFWSVLL